MQRHRSRRTQRAPVGPVVQGLSKQLQPDQSGQLDQSGQSGQGLSKQLQPGQSGQSGQGLSKQPQRGQPVQPGQSGQRGLVGLRVQAALPPPYPSPSRPPSIPLPSPCSH